MRDGGFSVPVSCCAQVMGGQSRREWVPGTNPCGQGAPGPRPQDEVCIQGVGTLKTGGVSPLVINVLGQGAHK